MSWTQVAEPHIGHRLTLKDAHALRCVDCAVTLVIHREPKTVSPSGPPPYKHVVPEQTASPELIALRKREALAAVEHARLKRTTAPEETA